MTERELYEHIIPQVAEMTVEARKLSSDEFQTWKRETIEAAPDIAKPFICKLFVVIENNL